MSPPLYQRVIDAILAEVEAGTLKSGDQLPSITQLAERHEVSPTTVKSALMILRARGVVRGQQGKATYIV